MITLEEIKVQIAIGSATKNVEIATLVRASGDPKAIKWATHHKFVMVRKAAAASPLIPFTQLLRMYFCDKAMSVVETCKDRIMSRTQEFEQLLTVMEEFPQFSLLLDDRKNCPRMLDKMELGDDIDEDTFDDVVDGLQRAAEARLKKTLGRSPQGYPPSGLVITGIPKR